MSVRLVRFLVMALITAVAMWLLFAIIFPWVDREFFSNPVLG